nr:rRNA maturation RNase YbeY [Actinomycetota bacterium]
RRARSKAGGLATERSMMRAPGDLHLRGTDHAEPVEPEAMQGREREHLERQGMVRP